MSTTHNVTDDQIGQCMEDVAPGRIRYLLTSVMQWIHSNLSPEDIWDTDYLLEVMVEKHGDKLCSLIAADRSVEQVFSTDEIWEWIADQ